MNVLEQKMKFKKKILKLYKETIFKFKKKKNLDKQILEIASLNELFNYFGTDKGTEVINQYQKTSSKIDQKLIGHGYAQFYEKHLNIYKNDKINILEIGTWKGASVAAFYHYFKNAIIFCIDNSAFPSHACISAPNDPKYFSRDSPSTAANCSICA